jgi:hypothetical protein
MRNIEIMANFPTESRAMNFAVLTDVSELLISKLISLHNVK